MEEDIGYWHYIVYSGVLTVMKTREDLIGEIKSREKRMTRLNGAILRIFREKWDVWIVLLIFVICYVLLWD